MAGKARVKGPGMGSVMTVLAAPALMATIAASYTAFWFYNVDTLKNNLAEFADRQKAAGQVLTYTYDGASGFPWRLTVDLKAVHVHQKTKSAEWDITAPTLTLSSGVFSPREVSISLPDHVRLTREQNGQTDYITKSAGQLDISVTTDSSDSVRSLGFIAANLEASGRWNGRELSSPLRIENGTASLRIDPPVAGDDGKQPFAQLSVALQNWQWPTNVTYTLGKDLESFELKAKLLGGINRLLPMQSALIKWRDDGGKVELNRIAMSWGGATVGGYGTMVLDENLQPAANLTAQVKGFIRIVDVLDQAGVIRAQDATMARLVIGRQLPQSGTGNLSLSLNDGRVYVGPLVLTKVPLVEWPADESSAGPNALEPGFDIGRDGQIIRK